MESGVTAISYDRLFLFLSTEFFVKYWTLLSGNSFSWQDQERIQTAAQSVVCDFMANEDQFWHIDFSLEREQRSLKLFNHKTIDLSHDGQQALRMLATRYCGEEEEKANSAFLMNFLSLISNDLSSATRLGLTKEDYDVIGACIEKSPSLLTDIPTIEADWLCSSSHWDTKIRLLTPDQPRYVLLDFETAYEQSIEIPTFFHNLSELIPETRKREFIQRLSAALEASVPKDTDLQIPKVLRNLSSL